MNPADQMHVVCTQTTFNVHHSAVSSPHRPLAKHNQAKYKHALHAAAALQPALPQTDQV
jgi:hypothetical protein